MSRKTRTFTVVILALAISGIAAWKFTGRAKRAPGYNVVFISMDTTRADFLGAYGNTDISTPNIDKLARQGVLFENFHSTINTTLAAHSSMFTGFYPRNHGVGRNSMRLNQKNLTLAEYLHAKGYSTAAFVGSFALASVFGINQGFQHFDESFIGNPADFIEKNVRSQTSQKMHIESLIPKTKVGHIERPAFDVNRSFESWLGINYQRKFFAFIHYYDPHFPYFPEKKWYSKRIKNISADIPLTQDARGAYENRFGQFVGGAANFRPSDTNRASLSPMAKSLINLYAAEIEYTDAAIGNVFEMLRKRNLDKNTIVIITADHGENLIEHQQFSSYFRHGFLLHQTEMRVPLILYAPGILPEERRVKEASSQIDVMPTLLDLMGHKPPASLDGVSLFSKLFSEGRRLERQVFSEASQPHVNLQTDARKMVWVNDKNGASVYDGRWKYITMPNRPFKAIYDLHADPFEEKNLIENMREDDPDRVSEFESMLKKWRSTALSGNVDGAFDLSDEDREKLESLGYVQ